MKFTSWLVMLSMAVGIRQNLTFDTAPYGRLPQGWSASCAEAGSPAPWRILKDATAPSQPYVLGVSDSRGCPVAIYNGTAVRDGEVSVKFKPVAGSPEQAGLVFRYRDQNNYYVVRADAGEKNVTPYRVQNGKLTRLAYAAKHNLYPNAWSILKVSFKGNSFSVYCDHRRVLRINDSALAGSGKVGLWTEAGSVTYFDNFRVVKKR